MASKHPISVFLLCLHLAFLACGHDKTTEPPGWDLDRNGLPRFATAHPVDISRMTRISKFRSGVGPDYSDDFEHCRSMLHRFEPRSDFGPEALPVFSPVDGTITGVDPQDTVCGVLIRSTGFPDFEFRLLDIKLSESIQAGVPVTAGQVIGSFRGSGASMAVAVAVRTPSGMKLVSFFDVQVAADSLFAPLRDCEAPATPSFIISREERDSHPLACEGDSLAGDGLQEDWITLHCKYDVDSWGIPRFADSDYIESEKILRISKFRSGIGHSYTDDFETCSSMKHYFQPRGDVDWSGVRIFSPVDGTVSGLIEEWAGTQVWIRSRDYPDFEFRIFHIRLADSLIVGQALASGRLLGTHIHDRTYSDIAVWVRTPGGRLKLLSWFDVMTDPVFDRYRSRGAVQRSDFIIPKEARDADPLCSGGTFAEGNLENWVFLGD
jgi:hypothetical protein